MLPTEKKISALEEARKNFPTLEEVHKALESVDRIAKTLVDSHRKIFGDDPDMLARVDIRFGHLSKPDGDGYKVGDTGKIRWIEREGQSSVEQVVCSCKRNVLNCFELIALNDDPEVKAIQCECGRDLAIAREVEDSLRLSGGPRRRY